MRAQIKGLEGKVGSELEEKFTEEDNRLQTTQNELDISKDISKMTQKANAELIVMQSYGVIEKKGDQKKRKRRTFWPQLFV